MQTAIEIPRTPVKGATARAFAAGTGVTTSLVAAAVLAFISVAALVAFNGMPFGSDGAADATVALPAAAPKAAALAASPTAGAVAASPARPSPAAATEILAALPAGARDGPVAPGTIAGPGGTGTTDLSGGGTGAAGVGTSGTPGLVQGAVGGVQNAAAGLGVSLPLRDLTDGITKPLDDTVGGALNGLGGGLGNNHLGDQVNGGLGQVTGGLGHLLG